MCSFSSSLERGLPDAIADHGRYCEADADAIVSVLGSSRSNPPAGLFGRRALLTGPGNRE
ncbi:hypothetical protein SF83666_c24380 [Sinorhizobium fredii CCBAU 83666]|nr:hypothetical protein SF83666_c24380 [Sinorhizobium fredii CCBAU 83666]